METQIENIVLVESLFKRMDINNVDISELEPSAEFHIETKVYSKSNHLIVLLHYDFSLHVKGKKKQKHIHYKSVHQAQYKVKSLDGVEDEIIDRFGSINGAAMLFPFVREDLMNISLKSGFQPIVLPVTNFVRLYEEKVYQKSNQAKETKIKK